MLKPIHLVYAARVVLLVGSLAVTILTLGPFQGLEHVFGLNDKAAHAIAFGGLTAISFLAFPSMRRSDLVWVALIMGAGIEVVQIFDNRSASIADWMADAAGVLTVYGSSMIETVRKMARQKGQMSFAEIAATDRRRRRRKRSAKRAPPSGFRRRPRPDDISRRQVIRLTLTGSLPGKLSSSPSSRSASWRLSEHSTFSANWSCFSFSGSGSTIRAWGASKCLSS